MAALETEQELRHQQLYMNEQPLSTIGGNLTYMFMILKKFINWSQRNTLWFILPGRYCKIITKKPNPDAGFGFDLEYGDVHDGTPDRSLTFVNIPLGDSAALRLVL